MSTGTEGTPTSSLPPRRPPAARIFPQGIFYGWAIAIAVATLMMFVAGIGYYGLAVFLEPLQEEHGWSNSAVSGAASVYFLTSGVTAAFFGPHVDRRGPMGFMTVGFLLVGGAAALIGFVQELWQLYAVYVLLALGFGMSSNVAVNAIMTRWFMVRRARAMSVSSTGISLGGVILAPAGAWLVDRGGLELAAPVMGAMVVLVALPVLWGVIAFDPRQMGLHPDGIDPTVSLAQTRARMDAASQLRRWTICEAMRTVSFWAVLVAFTLVLVSQTGFVIHQIAFLEDRLGSRSAAAFALSTTAFGSIVARLVVGIFADAIDKRWLTVVLFVVQASAVLLVLRTDNVALTYALTLTFGFTIGNIYMMQSLLVSEIFGMVSFGAVFGIIALAGQAGSGLGPFVVGFLEDRSGGYDLPFTVAALVTYGAAFVVLLARPVGLPAAGATLEDSEPSGVAAGG
ncbi:MAG: MFS transporter [Chloroflexi bacterium]|nr:MFS transporter [Chloroflexota bacterium]MDA1146721.1 MFS transporter [Chloroflexota bacterium]